MGEVKINTAFELLDRSWPISPHDLDFHASICGHSVYVVLVPFTQEDLDQYVWCLANNPLEKWVEVIGDSAMKGCCREVETAPPLSIPQLHIGDGVDLWSRGRAFVVIAEGQGGALRRKLFVKYTACSAAATMIHQVMNGYSVVFSGVVFKHAGPKIFPFEDRKRDPVWRKVSKFSANQEDLEEGGRPVIEVIC
ncbi:hypothetical protein MMC13_002320 [Lambiella insularis]|nr:hypothetical protein [Lambiella insularis]